MRGSVRKRGEKWYYSYEAASVDGKRKRIERVGGTTKKEAEKALHKAISEYNNTGFHFDPKNISVSDYLHYWYQNYVMVNGKYNTQKSYKTIIDLHICPILGGYALKSLTPAILQEFINNKQKEGISKSYLTIIFSILNASLKYAVYPCQFIKDNPMQYIKMPKYKETEKTIKDKIITLKDFDKIVEMFPFGSNFYMPFMIGFYTGLRVGEILALTWDDINFKDETINVNKSIYKRNGSMWCIGTPKTKTSYRTIKIGKMLLNELKKYKAWQLENRLKYGDKYATYCLAVDEQGNQYLKMLDKANRNTFNLVCVRENGTLITESTIYWAVQTIKTKLNIKNFSFHSLRHTHATILIESGANMKDVQNRLGHSKIATTIDTYTHVTDSMKKETVNIFERAICLHFANDKNVKIKK